MLTLLLVTGLAVAWMAWLVTAPWFTERRRARWRALPFPAPWRTILRRRVPFVRALPADLEPRPGALRLENMATRSLRRAGGAVAVGVSRSASAVGATARRLTPASRRQLAEKAAGADEETDSLPGD